MNVRCTFCNTTYRIDPARIPPGGVNARCARCQRTFRIDPAAAGPFTSPVSAASPASPGVIPGSAHGAPPPGTQPPVTRPAATAATSAAPASRAAPAGSVSGAPPLARGTSPIFGPQDPDQRAKRLARALVSDIVAYHQDRWERSLAAGTLREDFREEILKSWEEYVMQVGAERAHGTPYFRDALNEILAKGRQVF